MRKSHVAACAALAMGIAVPSASASVVSMPAKGLLSIAAGTTDMPDPGANNDITIAPTSGGVTVTDTGALITVNGAGCLLTSAAGVLPAVATCADPDRTVTHIKAYGGLGNDNVVNTSCIPALLDAGKGDDIVRGGCGADTVLGGQGHDKLYGGTGGGAIYTNGRTGDYNTQKQASSVFCVAATNTTVYANKYDIVAPECNTVIRVAPGQTPAQADGTAPATTQTQTQTQTTTTQAPTGSAAISPQLRIVSARVLARTLRIRGTLARNSTRAVRIVISRQVGRRTLRVYRAATVNRAAGTFTFTMKLGPRLVHARRLGLGVSYAGDQHLTPQTVRRTIAGGTTTRHR